MASPGNWNGFCHPRTGDGISRPFVAAVYRSAAAL